MGEFMNVYDSGPLKPAQFGHQVSDLIPRNAVAGLLSFAPSDGRCSRG